MKLNNIDVQRALAALENDDGVITPEAVVAAAAPPDSALHGYFTWDDAKAAHAHRLDQARTLIRSVKVEFRIDRKVVRSVAYVRDPQADAGEQGYRSVAELRRVPDEARNAVVAAFAAAAAHLRRARELADALGQQVEIDDTVQGIIDLRRGFEAGAQAS